MQILSFWSLLKRKEVMLAQEDEPKPKSLEFDSKSQC